MKLRRQSALNLPLQGSVGSFQVGKGLSGQHSIEVKYLLTYVGLDFSFSSNDDLLSEMAPVREIFDFNSLDFDEIMQRDIDDARVSKDLIPYLLDEGSVDLIKLFPPIVVVVLPVEADRNSPANLYPKVTIETVEKGPNDDHDVHITRAGPVGREVFQFEQPIFDDEPLSHDLVLLKLNRNLARLVPCHIMFDKFVQIGYPDVGSLTQRQT